MGNEKRNAVVFAALLALTCLALPAMGYSISGIVYNDINKNGVMERNENGLANVTVSLGGPVLCLNDKGLFVEPNVYSQNTTTNKTGIFNFNVDKFGRYFLKAVDGDTILVKPSAIDIAHPNDIVNLNLTGIK
ncbi:MAG: SdrD B-like domain-containing protein [Methanotrichaceae archaeon]